MLYSDRNKTDDCVFLKKGQKGHSEIFSHCIFSSSLIKIWAVQIKLMMTIPPHCNNFDVEQIHWALKLEVWELSEMSFFFHFPLTVKYELHTYFKFSNKDI